MFYFWFIPLAIVAALVLWALYLRFRRRAFRAEVATGKSPLQSAQEMEAREDAETRRASQSSDDKAA